MAPAQLRATLSAMLTRTVFACVCAALWLAAPACAAELDPSFGIDTQVGAPVMTGGGS